MFERTASRSGISGLSSLKKDHLAGEASRLAALLLRHILPVFSVVAPCHPGAALRDLVLLQRGPTTSDYTATLPRVQVIPRSSSCCHADSGASGCFGRILTM